MRIALLSDVRANLPALRLRVRGAENTASLHALPPQRRFPVGRTMLVVHGSPPGDTDYLHPGHTPRSLVDELKPLGGRRPDCEGNHPRGKLVPADFRPARALEGTAPGRTVRTGTSPPPHGLT